MKKLVIAPLALAASLALAGCTVEDTAAPIKHKADHPAVVTSGSADQTAKSDPAPTDGTQLGDLVSVGDWDVSVTKVELNANAILHKVNMFNDKPKGQYVLVTYQATYTGPERTADTDMDLSWSFTTTDNQVNDQSYAVTPADNQDWPTEARKGGTVKGQIVFDLAPSKVKGGTLTVEAYDANFDKVFADFPV